MQRKFQLKSFSFLSVAFFLTVIIGTLTHEMGHYLAAKLLGYSAEIHFDRTSYIIPEIEKITHLDQLLVTIGGPFQTIIFGTIGYIILLKGAKTKEFTIIQWVAVFLSFFWSRELFNLISGLFYGILNKSESFFGGDEAIISKLLHLPTYFFSILLGLIGLIILIDVTFRLIPKTIRIEFISSGLVSCFIGYYVWMYQLGSLILP